MPFILRLCGSIHSSVYVFMIYCIEYAKPISQIQESLNDFPVIFLFNILTKIMKIPELCCEALCFCLGEVHSSYKTQ